MLWKPRHNHAWRELQMEPDAHPWDQESQSYSPISRIAENVVIWHEDDLRVVKHHDNRAARTMRDRLSRYKRRFFVEDWEGGASKFDQKFKVTDTESIYHSGLVLFMQFIDMHSWRPTSHGTSPAGAPE